MPSRQLPVRPDFAALGRQAKELHRAAQEGEASAAADLAAFVSPSLAATEATLDDAQEALARSYGVASWSRLVLACGVIDAIWRDDVDALRRLIDEHPQLLHETAQGREQSNWGPPMSYAANLGRNGVLAMLHERGAQDVQFAFDRACLQGRLDTARMLHEWGARCLRGSVMGPAETLNADGLDFLLRLDAELCDEQGDPLAPVALVLQTYSRDPEGKHRCLELIAEHGVELPDTPPMAPHRGRIDLLEDHIKRDSRLLTRTFAHEEIFPPELGCHADHSLALCGSPLAGGTLLHLCVDYDEFEIAERLLAKGAPVDATAAIDSDGFGGHTALFGCVVSQPWVTGRRRDDAFARLLLDHGANPDARASLRKRLRFVPDETLHEYVDVTPLTWGERFHNSAWVNRAAMKRIAESRDRD